MMRKGVPHAKCNPLCAIKDSLKALWDRAGNCINRINDVSPDGDGDFTITGGDNVIVSSDPNGITIDTTGAVAYYSSSDPKLSIDNSNLTIDTVNVASLNDVQTVANDLSTAESDILTLQGQSAIITGDLITETTQRQAADATLQNNIDAVAASTAGLQGQIDLKRDRSDTVGYYAYTHNGVTQNETIIEDGTTAATIPVRDANGRMHAADPAAGATDKTLTTANWVSQTGDSAPNNLLHRSGNEKITANKMFATNQYLGCSGSNLVTNPTTFVAATLFTIADQVNGATHNNLGSLTKVRNNASQNYVDLTSTSYGYYENGEQMKVDIFIRLMINEANGSASLQFWRSKRKADGTGTTDTKTKTIVTISADGVIT